MQTIGIIKEAYNIEKTSKAGKPWNDAKLLIEVSSPPEIISISIPEEHLGFVPEWQKNYGAKIQVGVEIGHDDFRNRPSYRLYANSQPQLQK